MLLILRLLVTHIPPLLLLSYDRQLHRIFVGRYRKVITRFECRREILVRVIVELSYICMRRFLAPSLVLWCLGVGRLLHVH